MNTALVQVAVVQRRDWSDERFELEVRRSLGLLLAGPEYAQIAMKLRGPLCQLLLLQFLRRLGDWQVINLSKIGIVQVVQENNRLIVAEVVSLQGQLAHSVNVDALLRNLRGSFNLCFARLYLLFVAL
jgi:hypothetical protein